jgi:hypothetical protein
MDPVGSVGKLAPSGVPSSYSSFPLQMVQQSSRASSATSTNLLQKASIDGYVALVTDRREQHLHSVALFDVAFEDSHEVSEWPSRMTTLSPRFRSSLN